LSDPRDELVESIVERTGGTDCQHTHMQQASKRSRQRVSSWNTSCPCSHADALCARADPWQTSCSWWAEGWKRKGAEQRTSNSKPKLARPARQKENTRPLHTQQEEKYTAELEIVSLHKVQIVMARICCAAAKRIEMLRPVSFFASLNRQTCSRTVISGTHTHMQASMLWTALLGQTHIRLAETLKGRGFVDAGKLE